MLGAEWVKELRPKEADTVEEISLFEAIHTQRAIRHFTRDPVPDSMVTRIIQAAIRAPSGVNQQPWFFLVIRDAQTKSRIADYYLEAWEAAYGGRVPESGISPSIYNSADHLAHNMAEVPVIIMVCMAGGPPGPGPLTRGASIYPAVQNLLLAARALGLGTTLTTIHRRHEEEIKALLDIPENVETAALIPLGFPAEGEHFGGSRRRPAAEVTFHEKWGGDKGD